MMKVWVNSTNADVIVLSETRLKTAVHDKDICIDGYNLFQLQPSIQLSQNR